MDVNKWKLEKIRKNRKGREKDDENEKDENEKLNWLPYELEAWNLDNISEVDDNKWKFGKGR